MKTLVLQQKTEDEVENQSSQNIKNFVYLCMDKWMWFVVSLVICFACCTVYVVTTVPMYTRSASVHIKENNNTKSIGGIAEEFSALGITGTSSSVNNELVAFSSPATALDAARELHLEIDYRHPSRFRDYVHYGKNLPIAVSFPDMEEEDAAELTVWMQTDNTAKITSVTYKGETTNTDLNCRYGQCVTTPAGKVVISKSDYYKPLTEAYQIIVRHLPMSVTGSIVHSRIVAEKNAQNNSVIDITYTDEQTERAEDIINTIIKVYNRRWMEDKNELGVLTSEFIDERLRIIEKELGDVDSDISSYKSNHLITQPQAEASIYLNQLSTTDQKAMELNNQISMCNYLREYVGNPSNQKKLIPANVGIKSSAVDAAVGQYNEKLLTRNTYASSSSENNPTVKNLDRELEEQREIIRQSISNEISALTQELRSAQSTMSRNTSRLSSTPTQEKQLLSMDRQQKIKEALYLFLLQKREENEISQAFSAYNTRVITPPMGDDIPVAPMKSRALVIALLLGLLLPIVILYVRELIYTKVRGRADVEKYDMPIAGELPEAVRRKSFFKHLLSLSRKSKKGAAPLLVVKSNSRNAINEAFRVLRSNLSYLAGPKSASHSKVIMFTSSLPESGKTFISANLGCSFAIQSNKTVIVDLDIRKATLSTFVGSPKVGLTDYLSGRVDNWHDMLKPVHDHAGCDIIPAGYTVPNPSELLQSDRLKELIEELKTEYDYVILDTPPVDMVADVNIIKDLAELTLFVIRVGVMERGMLPVIKRFYQQKRFNNMNILLNGSQINSRHYGYGYGYGYGQTDKDEE